MRRLIWAVLTILAMPITVPVWLIVIPIYDSFDHTHRRARR